MHNNYHACCENHLMGFGFRRSWWPSKYAVAGCGLLVQTRIEEAPKAHQDARSLALAPLVRTKVLTQAGVRRRTVRCTVRVQTFPGPLELHAAPPPPRFFTLLAGSSYDGNVYRHCRRRWGHRHHGVRNWQQFHVFPLPLPDGEAAKVGGRGLRVIQRMPEAPTCGTSTLLTRCSPCPCRTRHTSTPWSTSGCREGCSISGPP